MKVIMDYYREHVSSGKSFIELRDTLLAQGFPFVPIPNSSNFFEFTTWLDANVGSPHWAMVYDRLFIADEEKAVIFRLHFT